MIDVMEETILDTKFVDADFFVLRNRDLERKYGMDWLQFEQRYKSDKTAYLNADFNEWAFLCRNFRGELLAAETDAKAPPEMYPGKTLRKPDLESGFFIRREMRCSILAAIFGMFTTR